jgi:hypothetical protein
VYCAYKARNWFFKLCFFKRASCTPTERPTAAQVRVKVEAALEAVRRRGREGSDGGAVIQAEDVDVGVSLGV